MAAAPRRSVAATRAPWSSRTPVTSAAEPEQAIRINRTKDHGPKEPLMIERESRVLELLMAEGLFEESLGTSAE